MSEIYSNIQSIGWWFTALFPFLVTWLYKKAYPAISGKLNHLVSKKGLIGQCIRKKRLADVKTARTILKSNLLITQAIIRNYTFFALFILSMLI